MVALLILFNLVYNIKVTDWVLIAFRKRMQISDVGLHAYACCVHSLINHINKFISCTMLLRSFQCKVI